MKRFHTLLLAVCILLILASCKNAVMPTYELGDFNVGDTGPAGGTIFYVDSSDIYPDFTYLESGPSDFGTRASWSNITEALGTTTATIGAGEANTTAIVDQVASDDTTCTDGAAWMCSEYSIEVGSFLYDDWYLPSIDEWVELYGVLSSDGDPGLQSMYWTSTEQAGAAKFFDTSNPTSTTSSTTKGTTLYIRPIRQF